MELGLGTVSVRTGIGVWFGVRAEVMVGVGVEVVLGIGLVFMCKCTFREDSPSA